MASHNVKNIAPIGGARAIQFLTKPLVRPGVIAFFRLISPFYLRALLGFRSVDLRHAERFVNAYKDFYDKKTRLIIAFRHPYGDEAQLMAYVIGKMIGVEAKKRGIVLARKPHAYFVHGYEVPLWAGAFERWLLPRVGAIPIYHTKFDTGSIKQIRSLMKDGDHPLALAPEGQVSYSSDLLPRLESGTSRICAWCAADLARESRQENVVILPISIHHRWGADSAGDLDCLIETIEKECGIASPTKASRFCRLSAAAEAILATAEDHYARFYAAPLPRPGNPSRDERLRDLCEAALSTAEQAFHLRPDGDTIRRVYKIRQAGWDRIFREDIPDPEALPGLRKALADRVAGEAWYVSRHMELVDLAFYLDFERLKEDDPLERFIETAQNYYDFLSRLKGGNITNRIGIKGKEAIVIAGESISATERLSAFGHNRKAAIESLDEDLKREFIRCIEEISKERKNG
ncbi:MAG TPA: hypothetical protein VN445_05690 [Rectinemataceae bacterium]|nr:hypothetical protein [Rectinemataceae bacterium]